MHVLAGPCPTPAGTVHLGRPSNPLAAASPAGLHSKLLVRGDSRAAYHNHILQHCSAEVRALAPDAGLRLETLGALLGRAQRGMASSGAGWCVSVWLMPAALANTCSSYHAPHYHPPATGGGRIEHYSEQRVFSVFGFSSAFGQAPHDVSAALLRRWLPRHDISVSYNGY